MDKKVKEWIVKAPWGNIAVVSWGNPDHPPVLLVHGYMDTAATFAILMQHLPHKYYYVGIDLPGHGKSDSLPSGLIVNSLHTIEPIRIVVEDMKWMRFIYMAHSMACITGLLYNQIFPNQIRKMIFLDIGPPLSWYNMVQNKLSMWYKLTHRPYYTNIQQINSDIPRLHTYDKAISLVVRNRNLTEEQADVVLSRSLVPMGIDTYKMSWEQRMKYIVNVSIPEETLYTIMTSKMPPTLSIEASEPSGDVSSKYFADNLLQKCEQTLPYFYRITVTGPHDFHIISPEIIAPYVTQFLNSKRSNLNKVFSKSKL